VKAVGEEPWSVVGEPERSGRGYKLQVSNNAGDWSDVYSTSSGNGEVDDIFLETPATGRYVRMLGIERGITGTGTN
jgi:hypothetical protein